MGARSAISRHGVAAALEAMLASPQFLFRVEAAEPSRDGCRRAAGAVALARLKASRYRRRVNRADHRPRSRLAAVLLPLGRRRRTPSSNVALAGPAERARHAREAGHSGCSRTRARPRSRRGSRAQWLRLNDVEHILPDAILYPYFDHTLGDALIRETAAVLRQHRARGSQRPRPADRRLHLRQRAGRQALRHPQRDRHRTFRRVHAARGPARPARPGQHPGADLGRRSHVAGDARQVDHGSAARLAAAAAAAERAGARAPTRPSAARCCRRASAWKSTARTRRARRATA